MALISWNENLSVGIKSIDEQHKKLVGMVNDLHSAMGSGRGKEIMSQTVAGLVEYTKGHFCYEEELMKKHSYPGLLNHKLKHDNLTKQVSGLDKKIKDGQAVVTVEVMNFLKDWLSTHIQSEDKNYGPFLAGKGVV